MMNANKIIILPDIQVAYGQQTLQTCFTLLGAVVKTT